jgi:hypothetical protein
VLRLDTRTAAFCSHSFDTPLANSVRCIRRIDEPSLTAAVNGSASSSVDLKAIENINPGVIQIARQSRWA